tara:strand:- start:69 stop:983 length:915 start_codon:yes stop_codon:yes gene_type:complete
MKFELFSYSNSTTYKIDESKYLILKKNKETLTSALALEEKFEMLIGNYSDFEKEILNVTVNQMVTRGDIYPSAFDRKMISNRRLVNLLTSIKLYIDSAISDVKNCVVDSERKSTSVKVKAFFSFEYDSSFEYRFMESLRNYVQHRGVGVHFASYGLNTDALENGESLISHHTNLYAHKEVLSEDPQFKKLILAEMDEKLEIVHAVRCYFGAIVRVHEKIRNIVSPIAEESRIYIENTRMLYKNLIELKNAEVRSDIWAARLGSRGERIDKLSLQLNWDDIRVKLMQRPLPPIRPERHYITGKGL